VQFSSD
jgi:transposase